MLCSLLKSVIQLQSCHNSHTSHCYVISFGAGKRLDVIKCEKYLQFIHAVNGDGSKNAKIIKKGNVNHSNIA